MINTGCSRNGVWLNLELDQWKEALVLEQGIGFSFNEKHGFTVRDSIPRTNPSSPSTDNLSSEDLESWLNNSEFHCVSIKLDTIMKIIIMDLYPLEEICGEKLDYKTIDVHQLEELAKVQYMEVKNDFKKASKINYTLQKFLKEIFKKKCNHGAKMRLSF